MVICQNLIWHFSLKPTAMGISLLYQLSNFMKAQPFLPLYRLKKFASTDLFSSRARGTT